MLVFICIPSFHCKINVLITSGATLVCPRVYVLSFVGRGLAFAKLSRRIQKLSMI
jgi:hypothetical protein